MKKIMIDMDDVIVKLSQKVLEGVNKITGENYSTDEIKTYYIQDLIPKEKTNEWEEYLKTNNLYEGIEIKEGAVEAIQKIQEKYETYLGSAFIFKDMVEVSGVHLKNKYDFLVKNIPEIKPETFVFLSNKEVLDCDIKIDDRIDNLSGNAKLKILFSEYHNMDITDEELKEKNVIRAHSWKEIEEILL